jgi:hypothetical protein
VIILANAKGVGLLIGIISNPRENMTALVLAKAVFSLSNTEDMFKRTVLLIKAGTLFLFATHATKRKEIMILKTVLNLCPLMSVKLAGVSQLYKV